MTWKSDQDPDADSHWFGSQDPDLHWNQCGSTTLQFVRSKSSKFSRRGPQRYFPGFIGAIKYLHQQHLLRTPIGHLSYFHVHNRTLNNTVNQGDERCVTDDRAYLSFCCWVSWRGPLATCPLATWLLGSEAATPPRPLKHRTGPQ